ncbi:MAG: hypothetical protein KGN78_12575 [Actinomycetales bacterium]|nr:hypothetical protein [Actinomycetales bacterium]
MTFNPSRIFEVLDRHRVDYLTIGAWAVIAHGYVRATTEIDPTDPRVLISGASFTMDTDAGPLDFLNDVPGAADYDQMRSRARKADAGGVTVWVVGYEDLIRMKEASGREQDLLDVHQLRDRHSVPR